MTGMLVRELVRGLRYLNVPNVSDHLRRRAQGGEIAKMIQRASRAIRNSGDARVTAEGDRVDMQTIALVSRNESLECVLCGVI